MEITTTEQKKYEKKGADVKDDDYTELEGILQAEMQDAKDFVEQIGIDRDLATEYYLGKEPVASSDLQSSFISTDVRDTILFMLPSIMRTFFGTKKVVEFIPSSAEDIPLAEQQTAYINHILNQKNNGFSILYSAFKDALIRKSGFVKAYWDDSIQASTHSYTNLSEEAYIALIMEDDVEVVEEEVEMQSFTMEDPLTGEDIDQDVPVSYDLTIRRLKPKDQVVIETIPPEEILVSRNARDLESSPYVAHRMVKTVSELVAMGYDYDEMMEYAGTGNDLDPAEWEAEQARSPLSETLYPSSPDASGENVLYVEHYLWHDLDDDGIAERIRICTAGSGINIVNISPWDDLPITLFAPDPEPHTWLSSCPADYLLEIQAAKSQIMRDTLDSLGMAIHPRLAITEGQVNIDDVLNTDIGQPVRVRAPGMIQPLTVPFVGREAFGVLNYLDESKENRSGISKASAGLNADALQSSTKTAVAATMSAAQGRIELICRHFANDLARLFKLINTLVIKHQEQEDLFKLNSKFVAVDPRYWDVDKDIVVNVAISKGSDEDKMQVLAQVSAKQEQILQTLGPDNPLVSMQQYANTLARIIELAGFKDTSAFVSTDIPPMPPQQQEEQKQDPATMLAMAEIQKAEAETQKVKVQAQRDMVDAETDRMKIIMEDDFKRDEAEADIRVKAAELKAKYGAQVNVAEINALMERDRETIRQLAKAQTQGLFNGTGGG